jgi:monovalent cation:H+ antiporter, CPA1 family
MSTASVLVILYCIATAVAIAVRRLRMPYTVALVIVGLALGSLRLITPPHLTQELLFTFFLPGLLFEAAFHLDLSAFRRVWRSAVTLAVPGVVVGVAITAFTMLAVARVFDLGSAVDLNVGLVFGALVAATDPVAVTALFRELEAPASLATLVESESLINDGTGVVFLTLVTAYVTGARTSPLSATLQFGLVAGGGIVLGVALGWLISKVIRRLDEPVIEIGLTVIAAYGSFVLAEQFRVSGVLATVFAGMMCGRHGRDLGMSAQSRAAVQSFWEYVAFALNSIVFLLIGFEFDARRYSEVWPELLIAFGAMLFARTVVVLGLMAAKPLLREHLPTAWTPVIVWGGLRGALSMVLALALPESLPNRELLVSLTVGVVLCSIIVQGLTMPAIVRRLGIDDPSASSDRAASSGV